MKNWFWVYVWIKPPKNANNLIEIIDNNKLVVK